MALVTLISGVCSAGVTFQITCQPMTQASANTVKCDRNSPGATRPEAGEQHRGDQRRHRLRGARRRRRGVAVAVSVAGGRL